MNMIRFRKYSHFRLIDGGCGGLAEAVFKDPPLCNQPCIKCLPLQAEDAEGKMDIERLLSRGIPIPLGTLPIYADFFLPPSAAYANCLTNKELACGGCFEAYKSILRSMDLKGFRCWFRMKIEGENSNGLEFPDPTVADTAITTLNATIPGIPSRPSSFADSIAVYGM